MILFFVYCTREYSNYILLYVAVQVSQYQLLKRLFSLLYVICCFSLIAFNIFSLSLIFFSLVNTCLNVFLFGDLSCRRLSPFPGLDVCFLSHVRKVYSYFLFNDLLRPLLFSFCDPYNVSVQRCPRGLRLSSFLVLFSLFCSRAMFFTSLSSSSLTHSSAPFILLWSPSSVFFMSVCSLNLLSLLNISCIFLVCVSVLFPTSWITFTVITLNSFQVDCLSLLH